MTGHAKLSPSSAFRWSDCTASPSQEVGRADRSNPASRQGTAGHLVSSECLEQNIQPAEYIGRTMYFGSTLEGERYEGWTPADIPEHEVVIDEDSAARCIAYVNFVRALVATSGGTLMVEQRVSIEHITGEKDAKGTSDAVLLAGAELIIIDAKFGSGRVNAYERLADGSLVPNKQLAMYADGSLNAFGWMGNFTTVRMIIVQPKLDHVSEFSMTVDELATFIDTLRVAAEQTRTNPVFKPTSDNCFFCKGRFDCAARQSVALEIVMGDFDDLSTAVPRVVAAHELGDVFSKLDLVEHWCSDMRTRVLTALTNGEPVVRSDGLSYKLVAGKRGSREWTDESVVEALLQKMRLKDEQMYSKSLISPTAAEKLSKARKAKGEKPAEKAVIGPTQWARLEAFITRPDPAPAIALESDPRPALADALNLFDTTEAAVPADSDLFSN